MQIQFTDSWGDTFPLWLYKASYANGNLAIGSVCEDTEDFAEYGMVTTNVVPLPEGHACLDTNNLLDLCTALLTSGDAVLTRQTVSSGYCTYPVARFTDEFLEALPTFEELAEELEG